MSLESDLFPVRELVEAIRRTCRAFPPSLAALTTMAVDELSYEVVEMPAPEVSMAFTEPRSRQIYLPLVDEPVRLRMLLREVAEVLLRSPAAADWAVKGEYARRRTAELVAMCAERSQLNVEARDLRERLRETADELKRETDGIVANPQRAADGLVLLAGRVTELARALAAAEERISRIYTDLGDQEF
jgi:hypothetical protein